MRSRLFTAARFALYGVLIVLGAMHLLQDGDASGDDTAKQPRSAPRGPQTSQGLPFRLELARGRVLAVEMTWRARCEGRLWINDRRRIEVRNDDGRSFAAAWTRPTTFTNGDPITLTASVRGEHSRGRVRGTARFAIGYSRPGGGTASCDTGAVKWNVPASRRASARP